MTTNSKIVKLEGVGEILFEKSSIAKNVRISFRPPSYIRVAVPRGVTFPEAQKFAEIKSAWIKKQIKRFSMRHNQIINSKIQYKFSKKN